MGLDAAHASAQAGPLAMAPPLPPGRRLPDSADNAAKPVMTLYLGVFLGVFCFFALLVGATDRSRSSPSRPPAAPAIADSVLSRPAAGTNALAALAAFAAMDDSPDARALQLTLPQVQIFADDAAAVRPSAAPLLDGVVAILASGRHAGAATAEIILLRPPARPGAHAGDAAMARRAQALARAFAARGAPIERLAIGIAAAAGDALLLTIRLAPPQPDVGHGG